METWGRVCRQEGRDPTATTRIDGVAQRALCACLPCHALPAHHQLLLWPDPGKAESASEIKERDGPGDRGSLCVRRKAGMADRC